ncbi:MAG: DUF2007 domain-containing protein [Rhodocyclaceae bacterium]
MKKLATCLNLVEAQHQVNLLLSAGIRAEVRNTFLGGAVGDIPFIEAGPQVWVDERQDAAVARAIIAEAANPPAAEDWCCEQCGETSEGQFAQCWHCGALRPWR